MPLIIAERAADAPLLLAAAATYAFSLRLRFCHMPPLIITPLRIIVTLRFSLLLYATLRRCLLMLLLLPLARC